MKEVYGVAAINMGWIKGNRYLLRKESRIFGLLPPYRGWIIKRIANKYKITMRNRS